MSAGPAPPAPAARRPIGLADLFTGFLLVGLRGFGGVLPWARRMLVDERRWLSDAEFTDLLSLCQLLPGPNIVNLSVALGARMQGPAGALAAFFGLMAMPLVIVLALGALYQRYGQVPALDPVFRDLGAAAAGLVVATGLKIAQPHWRKPLSLMIAGSGFAAVGLGHVPLIWAVLVLAPLSVLLHWRRDR